jgi:hypothetical protein
MDLKIKEKIYQAQCIGNVEPIEYMIPYPSMRSLIEGQNIKFSKQLIFSNLSITNYGFYILVQKTAKWLIKIDVKPKSRVIINGDDPFLKTVLLFGIWHLGATAILPGETNLDHVKKETKCDHQISINKHDFDAISKLSDDFIPTHKPLLNEEAVIVFKDNLGIKLSHYNLLVNVNSISKLLNLSSQSRISIQLPCDSISWIILGSILPIYSGLIIDNSNPEITIGLKGCNYNIRFDLESILNFSKTDIGICPENSGCLSLGSEPIHLTSFSIDNSKLKVTGHSVMMGYLTETQNQKSFYNKSLNIKV